MRIVRARPGEARLQAAWIVAQEPWRGLGYAAAPLGRWLFRRARQGMVRVARADGDVIGIVVVQPEVLLGTFIALVAVVPGAHGQGIGRALVESAGRRSRWLYTSSDAGNPAAARFYRKLGFERVGKLPGLIKAGRTELLWRRAGDA